MKVMFAGSNLLERVILNVPAASIFVRTETLTGLGCELCGPRLARSPFPLVVKQGKLGGFCFRKPKWE